MHFSTLIYHQKIYCKFTDTYNPTLQSLDALKNRGKTQENNEEIHFSSQNVKIFLKTLKEFGADCPIVKFKLVLAGNFELTQNDQSELIYYLARAC